ncbi:MAG TPA: hypothetical protein VMU66_02725 [Gaiellales bacterium]|nr:hypothetical protein [Gaiellales bacterium]
MGFLDKIKQQATDVASSVAEKTQETAKLTQLHASLKSLRNEERDALADFGRLAHGLHQQGALAERSGELAGPAAKVTDVQQRIADKEAEIADVKGGGGDAQAADGSGDDGSGETVETVTEAEVTDTGGEG